MGTAKASRPQLRKCHKLSHPAKEEDEDLLSRLHDEIIVSHILPRLTTDESVRTSILSRRWKNLWIHGIVSKLIFSHIHHRYSSRLYTSPVRLKELSIIYAYGISRVLETYPKPTLDELVVCFNFCSISSNAIDSWVEHALRKGVRRLELDLTPIVYRLRGEYIFPTLQRLSASHALCDTNLHNQPVRCAGLYNLKDICFKYVDVSSEVIEFMLLNCPSLERLSVWESMVTKRIIVSNQSVKLKSLEVVGCFETKIKISSSNLVSLRYSGNSKALNIKHAPLLSELSIGEGYCRAFLRTCSQNFRYLSQLRQLTLDMCDKGQEVGERPYYHLEFPQLANLEHLKVIIGAYANSCILWPIVLIKAAPFLHKLSVQLHTSSDSKQTKRLRWDQIMNLKMESREVQHQCLKFIEIHGFCGYSCELELGEHLLGISKLLRQVVISTFRLQVEGGETKPRPIDSVKLQGSQDFIDGAKQLKSWLPHGAEMLVL